MRTLAMHSDPGSGQASTGGGAIRPLCPSTTGHPAGRSERTAAGPPRCLVLALGLWLGATVVVTCQAGGIDRPALKPVHLRVTPAPFGLGPLAVTCDLGRGRSKPAPPDAGSAGLAPRARYRFRVADQATGRGWESDWREAPALGLREQAALAAVVRVPPDSTAAGRIAALTVTVRIQAGRDRTTERRRTYYRWRDGLFHESPEERSGHGSTAWTAAPQTDPGVRSSSEELAGVERRVSPRAIPGRRVSWGAVKVRYRRETGEAVTAWAGLAPAEPTQAPSPGLVQPPPIPAPAAQAPQESPTPVQPAPVPSPAQAVGRLGMPAASLLDRPLRLGVDSSGADPSGRSTSVSGILCGR